MPVEIGQLIINARVMPDTGPESEQSSVGSTEADEKQLEIIERCVAEVLRTLKDTQER